jgi:hypothetical protein
MRKLRPFVPENPFASTGKSVLLRSSVPLGTFDLPSPFLFVVV